VTRRPDLFIIGAAKCGTTSVYEWLKGHPDVFMSPAKEPRYFAPDLDSGASHNLHYGRDLDAYLALFDEAGGAKRVGEASVRYIYSADAPRLIHDFDPRPYIVAMVREPVEAIYSMHNQRASEGYEPITDFAEALAAETDRRAGRRIPTGSSPALNLYRDRGRFAQQLGPWFDTFERDRIHVIVFEDMVRDPAGIFRKLLEFLEVDADWQPESFAAHNRSHAPRSRTLLRLTRSGAAQWFVWQALPRVIGDRATRRLVRTFRHSAVNRRAAPRAPMPDELRRSLQDEFEPDVTRLSQLLGRDMGALWWGRPSAGAKGATEVADGTA
jgi:hypothetical protein